MSSSFRDVMIRIGLDPSAFERGSQELNAFETNLIRDREMAAAKLAQVEDRALDAQKKVLEGTGELSYSEKRLLRDRQLAARQVERAEQKVAQAREQVARGAMVAGGMMIAQTAVAVKKFADFDEAMSGVAATGDDARGSLAALREEAIRQGADTKYSATESANAIEELAKAGVEANDILGGALTGSLSLAAAGELEVADAAEITAKTMNQYNLTGADATRISDVLAASAGKAAGEVSDFGTAMEYVGPIAASLDVSLEETSGTLAYFAQNGLLADKAGTGLRGVLLSMAAPTKKAKAVMDEYNISAYDTQGKFIGISALAGELQSKLGNLSDEERNAALKRMFGNAQLTAAQILYKNGAAEVENWTAKVSEQGYAATTAATKMDNLKGDLEKLSGSIDTAFIKSGSGANDILRKLTQGAEDVVDAIGSIPEPVLSATSSIVGAGGLVVLGVAGAYKLVKGFKSVKDTLTALNISMRSASLRAGAVGLAVGAGALAFTAWANAAADAKARTEGYLDTLDEVGSQTSATMQKINDALSSDRRDAFDRFFGQDFKSLTTEAEEYGLAVEDLQQYILGNADAIQKVNAGIDAFTAAQGEIRRDDQSNDFVKALDSEASALSDAEKQAALKLEADRKAGIQAQENADATQNVASATDKYREAVEQGTSSSEDYTDALKEQIDAQREAAGVILDQRSAERNYQAAVDDSSKALEDYRKELVDKYQKQRMSESAAKAAAEADIKAGKALDEHTEAGRKNQETLDNIVESTWKQVESERAAGASQDELAALVKRARTQVVKQAEDWGMTKKEAKAYADELGLIPEDIPTRVSLLTGDASDALTKFIQDASGRKIKIKVEANGKTTINTGAGNSKGMASGGPVQGGQPGRDSVPILAMPGEHMWTTSEVDGAGGHSGMFALRAMARAGLLSGLLDGYADGGPVATARSRRDTAKKAASRAREALEVAEAAATRASRKSRDTSSKDKAKKDAAKTANDAAKDALKAARATKREADQEYKDAQEALKRAKSDQAERKTRAAELSVSVRRGEIATSVTSGGGLAQVDQLRSWSVDSALSPSQRKKLKALSEVMETRITSFNTRMEKANSALQEMGSVVESVSGSLSAESSLRDLTSLTSTAGFGAAPSGAAMVTYKTGHKERLKSFSRKLKALAAAGAPASLVKEVAGYGSVDGAALADSLLADQKSLKEMSLLYGDGPESISYWSQQGGQAVSESMGAGGYAAAKALVDTLTAEGVSIGAEIAKGFASAADVTIDTVTGKVTAKPASKKASSSKKSTPKKTVKKKALGGSAQAGEPILVGEGGPEVYWPDRPGHVVSASSTHRVLSALDASLYARPERQLSALSTVDAFRAAMSGMSWRVDVRNEVGGETAAKIVLQGTERARMRGATVRGVPL
ncbi:phage tail tape measure protein [Rarobacter faecitabidus]|uniref:TP901 family phage tail tape measure protein n=1 Tax=Rarobacter faecitabidus TaxID=13243 RepID=A0A542ZDY6_RARFA|nr:phage tail tape measure protein [Rarobacter faecitabidus]TQL58527.1 TP901 family phage tail tape measure protein [Rarobacter faecitabidus]